MLDDPPAGAGRHPTLFDARARSGSCELTAEEASLIAGFEVVIKNAAAGDGHGSRAEAEAGARKRFVELGSTSGCCRRSWRSRLAGSSSIG